jgi:5-methylcytosine-specific restriction endonuclease McrA
MCTREFEPKRPWQEFCSTPCRAKHAWWDWGWNHRYSVDINIWELLEDQDCDCALCGTFLGDTWEIDHIIPLSRGGQTTRENIRAVCQACNKGKWMMTDDEYLSHCEKVIAFSKARKRA